ncbi:MAG: FAD-binding protein [Planctomycetes bacterium]|nr:FAD-binding protein [Planctomycetota bacterium]
MSWLNDFADRIEHDAPIGHRTWFRLGGRARYLFKPRDADDLATLVQRARQEDVPVKVLGNGANVLICDDGFDGVVVRLDEGSFRQVEHRGTQVRVGAGVDLMGFARKCSTQGLSGLECMAGIPATIGGAVKMNAGGRFGDFGSTVTHVQVLRRDGVIEDWPQKRVRFGYRHTNLDDSIVLSATLALRQEDPTQVRRKFDETFAWKLRSQPMSENSAGCIFKNPAGLFRRGANGSGRTQGNALRPGQRFPPTRQFHRGRSGRHDP